MFLETITDDSGIVIPAVTVTVYDAGTTGTIPLFYAKSGLAFSGAGLDNLTINTPYAGSSDTHFVVQILHTGSPNKCEWSDDGGVTWDVTGIAITGVHLITGALKIEFGSLTGHHLNDHWHIYARPNPFVTDADGIADFFGDVDSYDEVTVVASKTDYSFVDLNAALEYFPVRGAKPIALSAANARGDLITANATPAWSILAKGSSGTYLRAGASDPAYSVILKGDLPTGIALTKLAPTAANTMLANATAGTAVMAALAINASELVGRGAAGNLDGLTGAAALSAMGVVPSKTELGYVDGVTSAIQTQLNEMALLVGRAGGQTLEGDTASGGNLTLSSTHHGTKGKIILGSLSAYDQVNRRLGLRTITPAQALDIVSGAIRFTHMDAPGALTGTPVDAPGDDGALTAGVYTYKVTFTNAIGETAVGTVSSGVTIGAPATDWKVSLTGIPLGTDATVTGRKIYRTASGGSTYYLVATIADNTTTELTGVNADNVSDATLITNALEPANSTSSGALYNSSSRSAFLEGAYFVAQAGLYVGLYGANRMLFSPGTYPSMGVRDAAGTAQCQLIFAPSTGAVIFDYNGPNTGTFQVRRQLNSDTVFKLDATGNLLFGGLAAVGTSAAKVIGVAVGTAPTTSPASAIQMWAADVKGVADKAGLHIRAESGGVVAFRSALGTVNHYTYQAGALADDGKVELPTGAGVVMVSCNTGAGMWAVTAAGAVYKCCGASNTDDANTDGKLCVYGATGVAVYVKNRLGATGDIIIDYWYN
jgi:hypothetical protein